MTNTLSNSGAFSLRRLLPYASFVGCGDITFSHITQDSRNCQPGSLFAALPGTNSHGSSHIQQASLRGAASVLTDRPLAHVSLPQCIVPDAPKAFGILCHALHGCPTNHLGVMGVTGTNGKTSTTWILRSLLNSASKSCGVIGTIEYNDGVQSAPAKLTTPDAHSLAHWLASMRTQGTEFAAIELSSHALHQQRAAGISLDIGVITNVTQDHLDYHRTFEDYLLSKLSIVRLVKPGGLVAINADCAVAPDLIAYASEFGRVGTYGIHRDADVTASIIEMKSQLTRMRLQHGVDQIECQLPLAGEHSVSNALAAVSAALHFGLSLKEAAEGLARVQPVPGRLEPVVLGQPFDVFVDYAHTPDALSRIIDTLKKVTEGRLIVVFGAGGDRDASKRPLMGAATELADEVIITSDNPRSEDPEAIAEQIRSGCGKNCRTSIELDRLKAIELAFGSACEGDTVLIAGKGHESTQEINGIKHPFDDISVCEQLLNGWGVNHPRMAS